MDNIDVSKAKSTKNRVKELRVYVITVLTCLLVLFWGFNLTEVNFKVPFTYNGDNLLSYLYSKTLMENNWVLINNNLGAPYNFSYYDFPMADNLFFAIIKILVIILKDSVLTINIYYLLTYVITAVTSVYVFRRFKIHEFFSIIGAIIYAFIPYHMLRGTAHLFLSSYFLIPLSIMVIIWIAIGDNDLFDLNEKKIKFNSNILISIIIILLVSSAGVYYAFFAGFFICIVIISTIIKTRSINKLINGLVYITLLTSGIIINLLPNILYVMKNGKNIITANRVPLEAEIYGMKITQLFFPIDNHNVSFLKNLQQMYINAPLPNEGSEYLGVIAIIGFIIAILLLFSTDKDIILTVLKELNLFAILLATIGGFGSIFSILISSQIRAYNRISIYIAFFGIFIAIIYANKIWLSLKNVLSKCIYIVVIIMVSSFSLYDQVSLFTIDTTLVEQEYLSDDYFIKAIEKQLPKGAMVFQLPYVPFPENPPINNMTDYELIKGYLHSESLRWSYPTMKGRRGDEWVKEISSKPVPELVDSICIIGFDGIYIDSFGYLPEELEYLMEELLKITNETPIISGNNRLIFIKLSSYRQKLIDEYGKGRFERTKDDILNPTVLTWTNGFSVLEGDEINNWRWSNKKGELIINNYSDEIKNLTLEFTISTIEPTMSITTISSSMFETKILDTNLEGQFVALDINVPPGVNSIIFESTANRVYAPNDPRELYFKVDNFKLEKIND